MIQRVLRAQTIGSEVMKQRLRFSDVLQGILISIYGNWLIEISTNSNSWWSSFVVLFSFLLGLMIILIPSREGILLIFSGLFTFIFYCHVIVDLKILTVYSLGFVLYGALYWLSITVLEIVKNIYENELVDRHKKIIEITKQIYIPRLAQISGSLTTLWGFFTQTMNIESVVLNNKMSEIEASNEIILRSALMQKEFLTDQECTNLIDIYEYVNRLLFDIRQEDREEGVKFMENKRADFTRRIAIIKNHVIDALKSDENNIKIIGKTTFEIVTKKIDV